MSGTAQRWMVVFGAEGDEVAWLEHPRHPGTPAWTYDRTEAEEAAACALGGGRVVDADEWVREHNARTQQSRTIAEEAMA